MTHALRYLMPKRPTRIMLGRRSWLPGRAAKLSESELMHHSLVLGTTGSGKTTAALSILCQAVQAGWGVVLIDLKGDPDNAACLAGAAVDSNVDYRQFAITPGERCDSWSPLAAGDAAARMSKVVCLSEWSEPYYRSACERFSQLAFILMERNGIEPSFDALIDLLDTPTMTHRLTRALDEHERHKVERYLVRMLDDKGQLSALAGLASRIGTLTDLGGPLRSTTAHEHIDLIDLSVRGGVCVFSLNSARSAMTASQVGALAVLDVQSMVAHRIATRQMDRPVLVCIDEFSALDADHVLGLFARARSSRTGMVLATQELADLARVREGFADQIVGLTNTKLILRQEVATTAETLARTIGTRTVVKASRQTDGSSMGSRHTGRGNERAADEFIFHPNIFKRLNRGQAVLLRKDPFRCERINIKPRLAEPFDEATVALPLTVAAPAPRSEPAPAKDPDRAVTTEELDALFERPI